MPEGPEIRRAADKIHRALAGNRAQDVFFAFDHLKPYEDDLVGCTITQVIPYGKALVTAFDNGLGVYSHNQLYGRWVICKPQAVPATGRQLRFAIHTELKWALLYSASEIEVLALNQVPQHPYIAKLGPDTLDITVTPDQVAARALGVAFQRRRFAAYCWIRVSWAVSAIICVAKFSMWRASIPTGGPWIATPPRSTPLPRQPWPCPSSPIAIAASPTI